MEEYSKSKSKNSVEKASIKVKGVTYFERQDHLKTLYEQHLPKEEKHLSLEKFYVGSLQTFCVIMNGLEIGTIPEEHLKMFYSADYDYELNNIHIDFFTNEYGRRIYWAKLFVIFSPKQRFTALIPDRHIEKKSTEYKNNDNKEVSIIKNNSSIPVHPYAPKSYNNIANKTNIATNKSVSHSEKDNKNFLGGCSDIITLAGCTIMIFAFIYLSFYASLWYLFGVVFCLLGALWFAKDLGIIRLKPQVGIDYYNTTLEEKEIINSYRIADNGIREEILMILSLEPVPEMKKKKYKKYSRQESNIILTYRISSKAIQTKVKEKLKIENLK